MKNNTRIKYLDLQIAQGVYEGRVRALSEDPALPVLPGRLQSRQSWLCGDYLSIARYNYALGYPIEQSWRSIIAALAAYRIVTELRGTETVEHTRFEATRNPLTGAFDISNLQSSSPQDYSTGNSTDTFRMACLALMVNDWETAEYLAGKIYDPEDAGYVGTRSRIEVTPDHQKLSYAFRDYIAGTPDSAADRLSMLFNKGCRIKYLQCEARVLRRILTRNKEEFINALNELLAIHVTETKKVVNKCNPNLVFATTAVGMIRLALRESIIGVSDVPNHEFIPKELMFFKETPPLPPAPR